MRLRRRQPHRHWSIALLAGLYTLGFSHSLGADDIDIFFGGPEEAQMGRANVLFVLDDSGSMRWDLERDSNPSGGRPSRMAVLQDAFREIMTEAQEINAGLMTLNNGRFLHPVTNIDTPLDQGDDSVPTTPVLTADGHENSRGDVDLSAREHSLSAQGSTLSRQAAEEKTFSLNSDARLLGQETSAGSGRYHQLDQELQHSFILEPDRGVALVFDDLELGTGSQVHAARLKLYPRAASGQRGSSLNLSVALEARSKASQFNGNNAFLPELTHRHSWRIEGQLSEEQGPLELTGLEQALQALLEEQGALEGVALYLTLENSSRGVELYGQKASATAPQLLVDASRADDSNLVALRFKDIPVPRGAVIESAFLELDPSSNSNNNLAIELRAENSGNSLPLSEETRDLSRRSTHNAQITWTTQGSWQANEPVLSSDIAPLIQAATGHSAWCGNNALTLLLKAKPGSSGVRSFHSLEGSGQSPKLHINFVPGSDGCSNDYLYRRTAKSRDDVYQRDNRSNDMNYTSSTLRISSSRRTGLHFTYLPIRPGAQILEARLALTLAENSPSTNLSLGIENSAHAAEFSGARNELRDRNSNSYTAPAWSVERDSAKNSRIISPDFSAQLQRIVDKGDWNSGQAIALHLSGGSELKAYSFDHSPSRAPQLMLKISHGGLDETAPYTVRNKLIELVDAMKADGGTPIAPTMLDASEYYLDESGKSDWPTPIEYPCQSNHLVLLTDGQANGSNWATRQAIGQMIGNSSCSNDANNSGEQCVRSLSHWLGQTDLSSEVDEHNNLTVHTIGFAMGSNREAKDFMRDLAQENQGCSDKEMDEWERDPDNAKKNCGFYLPDNAASLVDAFNQIFNSINSVDSSFVSPGAGVNQFNRAQHRNELYFSLFKPVANERWPGNLKRYALGNNSRDPSLVEIQDVIGAPAVNSETGFFKESAQSYWSPSVDGNMTEKGGMASRLPSPSARRVFTLVDGALSPLETSNNAITAEMLGASSDEERSALINWARGRDQQGNARNAIGDPLHSRPALLTYRCSKWADAQMRRCAAPSGLTEYSDNALLFGTNEGFVHLIDTAADSGEEHFAFIPPELLGNLKIWKNNPQISRKRHYGMDGSPTLWINDANRNGVIYGGRDTSSSAVNELPDNRPNDGEFVYAYIGMRRGGQSYYALDITDARAPKALWSLQGRQGAFTRLGQSWARPIKTRVNIDGEIKDVLLISGGYDETQDQDDPNVYARYRGGYKEDSVGNALYMVDAASGELLWSASAPGDPGRQHNLTLNRMRYSIPGGVRAVDLYGDGLADQLFFADLGGQVWRLYINNGEPAGNLVWPVDSGTLDNPNGNGVVDADDGVMAYLGYPSWMINDEHTDWAQVRQSARRFYHEPDISIFRKNGTRYLAVSIGSGFHADPLGKVGPETENMFFMLSTTSLANPIPNRSTPAGGMIPRQTLIHMDNGKLADVTLDMHGDPLGNEPANWNGGWYIRLAPKELVTAPALTQDGVIYFNSYQPGVRANSCNATDGLGRAYAVQLQNGAPAANVDNPTPDDRYTELGSGGMPPGTIILRPDGENEVICIGAECESRPQSGQYGRTHWREVD